MTSPARQHRERVSARIAHEVARTQQLSLKDAKPYDLMLAKLHADMRRLKLIQSIEKKIDIKRQLLPEYVAWIDGALQAESGEQDDVLMTVMVWRIDTGDVAGAIQIGEYALRHNLQLPSRYNRTLGCLIAEEIAEGAKREMDAKGEPSLDILLAAERLTAQCDMPDEVRAKLKKVTGLRQEQLGQLEAALENLRQALVLHNGVGVKKDIERIERAIKNKGASDRGVS
jgi:hypothetical protein